MGSGKRPPKQRSGGDKPSSLASSSHSNHHDRFQQKDKDEINAHQLYHAMEEVLGLSPNQTTLSWKDCLLLMGIGMVLGMVCVSLGVAAGNVISIHYYGSLLAETPPYEPVVLEEPPSLHQRVTLSESNLQEESVVVTPPEGASSLDASSLFKETDTHDPSHKSPAHLLLSQSLYAPTLCPDQTTYGYSDWHVLRHAIHEANHVLAEERWNGLLSSVEENDVHQNQHNIYEEDYYFTICPGIILKARRAPIWINAPNLVIECDDCSIVVGGTHLSFGPHAQNVLVRGMTFCAAETTSLVFHHHGADVSFEDCVWTGNAGSDKQGAVADVNSTSHVTFYRCDITDMKQVYSGRNTYQRGKQIFASSLTIRKN